MRDELDTIYQDEQFQDLFPSRGKPAEPPWKLALATIFQFAENLADRQAADAVRARIDWKYALSLELTDAGFAHTVLSEFRSRLIDGGAEHLLLDVLLERFRELGLLRAGGSQRTDSTHVLAAVRALNRLELVGETMRHVLNVLADVARDWLRTHAKVEWVKRYQRRSDEYRLPKGKEAQRVLADQIGRDGAELLSAIYSSESPGLAAARACGEDDQTHLAAELPPDRGGGSVPPGRGRSSEVRPLHQLALRWRRTPRQEGQCLLGRL
jgi:transposase